MARQKKTPNPTSAPARPLPDKQTIARARRIARRLDRKYPSPRSALDHSNPLELLVATILSAQCTDQRVNQVTPDLFKRYKSAADYARADQAQLEELIRSTGFFRNKARNLRNLGAILRDEFGGNVPDEMADLLRLPGVARKTANVVLGDAFGKSQGIAVDRHVMRVAGRLGLTAATDPVKIEADLMACLPRERWTAFSHQLIYHGRETCTARKPNCPDCLINDLCPSAFSI